MGQARSVDLEPGWLTPGVFIFDTGSVKLLERACLVEGLERHWVRQHDAKHSVVVSFNEFMWIRIFINLWFGSTIILIDQFLMYTRFDEIKFFKFGFISLFKNTALHCSVATDEGFLDSHIKMQTMN